MLAPLRYVALQRTATAACWRYPAVCRFRMARTRAARALEAAAAALPVAPVVKTALLASPPQQVPSAAQAALARGC